MAGKVLNIKAFSPLKLHLDLTGKCHAICHYSYNLPVAQNKRFQSIKEIAEVVVFLFDKDLGEEEI
jgi:hypothetical protein